jgi:hypothetical protein
MSLPCVPLLSFDYFPSYWDAHVFDREARGEDPPRGARCGPDAIHAHRRNERVGPWRFGQKSTIRTGRAVLASGLSGPCHETGSLHRQWRSGRHPRRTALTCSIFCDVHCYADQANIGPLATRIRRRMQGLLGTLRDLAGSPRQHCRCIPPKSPTEALISTGRSWRCEVVSLPVRGQVGATEGLLSGHCSFEPAALPPSPRHRCELGFGY